MLSSANFWSPSSVSPLQPLVFVAGSQQTLTRTFAIAVPIVPRPQLIRPLSGFDIRGSRTHSFTVPASCMWLTVRKVLPQGIWSPFLFYLENKALQLLEVKIGDRVAWIHSHVITDYYSTLQNSIEHVRKHRVDIRLDGGLLNIFCRIPLQAILLSL